MRQIVDPTGREAEPVAGHTEAGRIGDRRHLDRRFGTVKDVLDQLLLLEQLQRVTDRLTRHTERSAQLFLTNPLIRGERAAGDCLDQLFVGAIDQCRLWVKKLHERTPLIPNSEFHDTCTDADKKRGGCARTRHTIARAIVVAEFSG